VKKVSAMMIAMVPAVGHRGWVTVAVKVVDGVGGWC